MSDINNLADLLPDNTDIENMKTVKIYDFKRPDKFPFDQIRTLSMIHETFARLATISLSEQLRSMAHIHVSSVDQLTYEEFIRSIPNPTTLAVLNMKPFKGNAVLEIDDSIMFSIIDRLLGGSGKYKEGFHRELTSIEIALAENIITKKMNDLNKAWSNIIDLKSSINKIEVNPQFAQIVPPKDMVILVTFEVLVGKISGYMNLCLPYITIEPIIQKLSAKYWFTAVREKEVEPSNKIANLKIDIKTIIKGEKLSLKNINELKAGSLIKLENYNKGEAYLYSSCKPIIKLKQLDEKKRNNYEFEIINEKKPNNWLSDKNVLDTENKIAVKNIENTIEKFNKLFSEALNNINTKIEKLNEKQDALVDQISFSTENPDFIEGTSFAVNKNKPFDFLRLTNPSNFLTFIQNEHPQTIALILSYLDPDQASKILSGLTDELQAEVIERIAVIDRTSPEILHTVESILEKKLKILESEEYTAAGGIQSVVDILNISSRKIEMNVLKSLEKSNPELNDTIKKNMFVFDDISSLDKNTIEIILNNINIDDLSAALKAVGDNVKKKIISCLKKEDQKKVEEKINTLNKIRLKVVEKAQQKIINIVKKLEEEGLILIPRANEEII